MDAEYIMVVVGISFSSLRKPDLPCSSDNAGLVVNPEQRLALVGKRIHNPGVDSQIRVRSLNC